MLFYGNLSSKSYKEYAKAGKKYTDRDVVFGHTEYPMVLYAFNISVPEIDELQERGLMVLINKSPPNIYHFEEEFSYKSLRSFLNYNMKRNWEVLDFTVSNRIDRMDENIFVLFKNGEDSRELEAGFKLISPQVKRAMTPIVADVGDGEHGWRFG